MIVTGTPLIRIARPITDGSAPNCLVHVWCPMIPTTSALLASSSALNQRPSEGFTPNTDGYVDVVYSTSAERSAPSSRYWTGSGTLAAVTFAKVSVYSAMSRDAG